MSETFSQLAARANGYPLLFNAYMAQFASIAKTYVDSLMPGGVITTEGDIIVADSSGDPSRLAKGSSGLPLVAGASTISYAALSSTGLASGSVTLAKLASGVTPSHVVKYAGTFTTAGGDASETISVPGVAATDIVAVTVKMAGVSPESIVAAAANTDQIDVTMSGDPSTDHVLQYVVFRAAS